MLSLILCLCFKSFSQSEKAFSKGNSVISAGVGIGNIWKTFLKNAFTYPPGTYNVKTRGTYTLVYEYGFSNRISGGLALGYSDVYGKFDGYGEKFTETLTNYSLLVRSNYHFGKIPKFDPYIGAGLGYYRFKYYNNKPGIVNSKVPGSFGYSAQLGAHYYFSRHLGAYAEVGYVGGSIGQLGVTYKW
ncbi:MAG: OmpW family outer membrane protein [Ferruginibacter sp.]